jgi:phosphatidylserine/phosphatidylglycerophosphate/cardiolipin synthase-like enzyme
MSMAGGFQVSGSNTNAPFTLKVHRGEGMALLAMDWKNGTPPDEFVGFAIEYQEPGGDRFFSVKNRLSFESAKAKAGRSLSTLLSPIQMFRWVHMPRNAEKAGSFIYRVTPVFMNDKGELSYGPAQEAPIELRRETYVGLLNVAFTRGFVSSQAFVDNYASNGDLSTLLPAKADDGLDFVPTHPKADEALAWMGFEGRSAILQILDEAIQDDEADVRVVAYDLNEPEIVSRLQALKGRLKIIIDDEGAHGQPGSAENEAEVRLRASAGQANVIRQHMDNLQHNKTIVVNGPKCKKVVCGSTNYSWRGLFVQSNNALTMVGSGPVNVFLKAFENYWSCDAKGFRLTESPLWTDLGLAEVKAKVTFSPHGTKNAALKVVADDIRKNTTSSLFYSLAFLNLTKGSVREAVEQVTDNPEVFVYGIADQKVSGFKLQKPDGNKSPVYAAALSKDLPMPFKAEPTGGGGVRMHHKFVVIDFDKPSARVYLGSYNFSSSADGKNGENLVLVKDRRVAVAYMIEALRIFDHYHFRINAKAAGNELVLAKPPKAGEKPWWAKFYEDPVKRRDRLLFA